MTEAVSVPPLAKVYNTTSSTIHYLDSSMDIPNELVNKVLNYLLRQADTGDTEAEELLDELNELNE